VADWFCVGVVLGVGLCWVESVYIVCKIESDLNIKKSLGDLKKVL
jgi:hypothetical protein